ncbi:MAG TPA: ATP-binding protein [Vicinamibacteria bacterium]|jgi:two-component system phosphate regulon sensor histidine kinase PhoR
MLGLRERIGVTALAASVVALATVMLAVAPGLRGRILDHTRETLLAEARLMARVVEPLLASGAAPEQIDALVDRAAREVSARVTIIAPDGRVLADSAVSGPELLALENHAERPEVVEARRQGLGTAVRRSATVRAEMLYAAVRVQHDERLLGFARVALPLTGVDEQYRELRQSVAVALGLALVVTMVLAMALSAPLAGPLRQIMEAARQFAAGQLDARSRVNRSDELGELAKILNRSADHLQARLTEIARDRARTQALLASMEDGLLAVDHTGTVVVANEALVRSLGLKDPLGRHYLEALRQREVGEVVEAVLGRGERQSTEVEIHRLRRAFALSAVPFPGEAGGPHGAVLTFHDVTERRRVDQVRRDFVANASHELRTPLTSIRGFVEALEDGAVSDAQTASRFLGKIRTHADRMAALVDDLLALSRLESGTEKPNWEEVTPGEIVADVAASFADLAGRKGIALSQADRGAPAVVCDGEWLRRILSALVENAVKYTPAGGYVAVECAAAPGGAALTVTDDGPGVAPEHLPRLFERFYRVDKARSRELGGTGLGLSIVKHLAEGMSASVAVESQPGRGARFTVTVPARPLPRA